MNARTTKRMDSIVHQAYRVAEIYDGNNLILQESSNSGNPKALYKIKLNVRHIEALEVYKFDQSVTIAPDLCETYAPFLQAGRVRAMCDFVIFFHPKADPETLCTWVVNLKSKTDGNNIQQMRAGQRLGEFLLGKLDDELKIQDKPQDLPRGPIDFVLFSLPQTRATQAKTGTNALSAKKPTLTCRCGATPDAPVRVTQGAYELRLLERE